MERIKKKSLTEDINMGGSTPLTFNKGWGYWDLSKYPYGGDFKRFNGNETGELIAGPVKKGEELRIKLSDGRTIIAVAQAVANMGFDEVILKAKEIGRTFGN